MIAKTGLTRVLTVIHSAGTSEHPVGAQQSSYKVGLALMLPLVGYAMWAVESFVARPNPIWASALFVWAICAAGFAWWLARGAGSTVLNLLDRHASTIVKVLIAVFSAILIVVTILQAQYFALSINSEDTAYYSQVFWNTLHGDFLSGNLQQERLYDPPVSNDLALHVSPVLLVVLLPIYAVFPDFVTLLIIRDVVLAAAAWPLFLLARERIGGAAGVAAVILYLASPPVIAQGFESFTLLQLAPLPFFWALRAFVREESRIFLLWTGIAMSVREDVAITIAGFGLWALVKGRAPKWFIFGLGIPVIWWSLATLFVQPAFGRWGNSALDVALAGGSQNPLDIYQVLLGSPSWILDSLRQGGFDYLYRLLRSVGLLGALGWEGVLAAPGLLANLFLTRVYFGGGDPIGRFAILPSCALVGVAVVVVSRIGRKYRWDMGAFAVIMLLLLPSVNLLDGAKDAVQAQLGSYTVRNNAEALREAVGLIPATASVAAPNYALPALSNRPKLYYVQHLHSYPQAEPEYILIDRNLDRVTTNPGLRDRYMGLLASISRPAEYETVWQNGEYLLVRRAGLEP